MRDSKRKRQMAVSRKKRDPAETFRHPSSIHAFIKHVRDALEMGVWKKGK